MLPEKLIASPAWLGWKADRDVIIASSVRLSRNLEGALFPWKASLSELSEVRDRLLPLVQELEKDSMVVRSEELDTLEFRFLCDRFWFSPGAKKEDPLALVVSPDASSVFTINEADHLSLTACAPGLDLTASWQRALRQDRALDTQVPWAASLELGYHTVRPEEHGAALQASVLAFLPGIVEAKVFERVLGALTSSGIKARLREGEKTSELSSPYVEFWALCPPASTEEEFLSLFSRSLESVIDGELRTRERIVASRRCACEDRTYRAAAILSSSRMLPEGEAHALLADLRYGLCSGLIALPLADPLAEIDVLYDFVCENRVRLLAREQHAPDDRETLDALRSQLVRSRFPRYDMG